MLRILPNILMIASTIFTVCLTDQVEAYCAKCIKIEEDRAREQAANPQPFHYYDDLIGLHSEDSASQKETSEKGSGALKGSFFHSTEKEQSSRSEKNSYQSSQPERNTKKDLLALNTGKENSPFFEEGETPSHSINSVSPNLGNGRPEGSLTSSTPLPQSSSPYSTIYTIFKTKNFLETLNGSFTLFIPTNEAIRRLSPGALMNLAAPENSEKLAALVSNHVVARKLLKEDFDKYNNLEIKAISGRNLTLSSKNGKLFIENAQILRAEPAGEDGVIYIIDKVLVD